MSAVEKHKRDACNTVNWKNIMGKYNGCTNFCGLLYNYRDEFGRERTLNNNAYTYQLFLGVFQT